MRSVVRALLSGSCALIFLSSAETAFAQSAAISNADLAAELEAMRAREQAAQERIQVLEKRLEAIEAATGLSGDQPIPDNLQSQLRGRGLTTGAASAAVAIQTTPEVDEVAASDAEDRKAPAPPPVVEQVTEARQGYFGRRFNIEPGITYSHFSNAQLNLSGFLALDAIFLGLISIDEVNADVLTTDVTGRFGVTNRFQLDANVPYLFRRSNFQSGGAGANAEGLAEKTVHTKGLGDISMGASYRVFEETAKRPDVVFNARVKAPTGRHPFGIELVEVEGTEGNLSVPDRLSTGTGVWSAAAGLSLLKTIDPMVVYGSLTYFHNFKNDFNDIDEALGDQPGTAKLGNSFQYGVGVAYALNDRSSINMAFTQRFVSRSKLRREGEDWEEIVGSQANIGLLNIGATFSLSDQLAVLVNLGAGLTDDAPDMAVNLRVPYSF
jgi:hypothetical protein